MAKNENSTKKKGTFSDLRLAVARKYIFPDPRRAMMAAGGLAGLAILAYYVIDFHFLKSNLAASGPLSSFHANFEKDCAACHQQFDAATNAKCSVCHEKTGDEVGVYTFAGHYIYRSGDARRIKDGGNKYSAKEENCAVCHQEHLGRAAAITKVSDAQCISCHVYGSFNKNHPQFQFAAQKIADDTTLAFTHIRHVKEVVKREKLADIERACLYCHNPQPDGQRFAAIDFDTHCSACHLTASIATPALKMKSADDPLTPGVETLEAMRRRGGPGMAWASNSNPNEFQIKPGNRLIKSPVRHQDPWILENLKMLRRALHPSNNLELADLLKASGKNPAQNGAMVSAAVYQEALQALENYAAGLRGRPEPEVQKDLIKIDSLLKVTRNRLRRQTNLIPNGKPALPSALGGPGFLLPPNSVNPNLAPDQVTSMNELAESLTQPCRECHTVANASIVRVQKDQQILRRAQFNHRAHIVQRRCLECHTEIPIIAQAGVAKVVPASLDRAAIQNIPGIENCRVCHNANETSNRCVTCHYFHPNKTNRSNMLLYLD
ncbi:cytochrome c3 family protein [candidate division KSB1 bacterium]|nr:cytochrome c3 family protein [candidate division KSB1 bacterium]